MLRTKQNIGGRPKKDIPTSLTRNLFNHGMSARDIARELKAQGQIISAMTVNRVLSGEKE